MKKKLLLFLFLVFLLLPLLPESMRSSKPIPLDIHFSDCDSQHVSAQTSLIQSAESPQSSALLPLSRALLSSVSVYAYSDEPANAGSGVVYLLEKGSSAVILTNYHVIYSRESDSVCSSISVFPYALSKDGPIGINAELIGFSREYDIALLKIDLSDHQSLPIEGISFRDNFLLQGESIIAVSNSMGKGLSVTSGTVSVCSESIYPYYADTESAHEMRVMRISAQIHGGSSGGGVFSSSGHFLGLITAKSALNGYEGVGYALPFESVKSICDVIMRRGSCLSYILGAELCISGKRTYVDGGRLYCFDRVSVSKVTNVDSSLGLCVGDELISLRSRHGEFYITHKNALYEALLYSSEGETVTLRLKRGGITCEFERLLGKEYFSIVP